MVLQTKQYRVRAVDAYNFVIEEYGIIKKGKGKGKEYIINANYFRTLEQVFQHLVHRKIAHLFAECEGIEQMVYEIRKLEESIKDAVRQEMKNE